MTALTAVSVSATSLAVTAEILRLTIMYYLDIKY